VLWTFALPQPTFAEIDTQPELIANAGGIDLVLFAVGFTFLPPAILLLVELAAARAGERTLEAVHLLLVTGLATMIASPVIFRLLSPSSLVQSVLALGAGAAFGIAYARLAPVRSLTTVLVPAPLLFVLIFLFTSPASDVVLAAENDVPSHRTPARAPVVFVVFDEFNSAALMDSSGELDAGRYPNFARLARSATWFRNATADHSFTELAVPTMLTGRSASQDSLPWASEHPRNLFTMLGGYEVEAVEQVTDLCPERLCPERGSFPGRLPALYRDLSILGLKAVMPDAVSVRLPRIDQFELTPQEEFSRLLSGIRPTKHRMLNFAHLALPHITHDRLPSGKRYPMMEEAAGRPGGGILQWIDDPWLAIQGYQRYLLQVGYTDRLLGKLLDRLEQASVYDRAVVIVTADHGVSHRPGDERRAGTRTNLEEIMPVPLFVKAPNQRRARVVDQHVQTVDVLPTLTDILGVRPPSDTDGRSGLDPGLDRRRLTLTNLAGPPLTIGARALDRRRAELLRRQVRLFGEGDDPDRVYEAGLDRGLRGRSINTLSVSRHGGSSARILDPASFAYDPRNAIVPARLAGELSGARARAGMKLVIALNGRIRAATRTYVTRGRVRFSAMLPPSRLRSGRNTVEVFGLSGSGRRPLLEFLARNPGR